MNRKRDAGQGTLVKRADGRWQGSIRWADETGRARRSYVYAPSKAAARAKLREASRRVGSGSTALDSTMTLTDYCAVWEAGPLLASDRSPATRSWYRTQIRHIVASIGRHRLDRLRASHVETLVATLREAGRAASTIRGCQTVLRAILATAQRDGLVATNVAAQVSRPKVGATLARALSTDEVAALLSAMDGHRLRALVIFLLGTGVRRSEALALSWTDVDLDAGTVDIRGSLTRTGGALVVGPTKARAQRHLALAPSVVATLRAHRSAQRAARLAVGSAWTDSGFVFVSQIGTPWEPRNVSRAITAAARKAGLAGVSAHTLRHTFASHSLTAGVPLSTTSKLLGHASVAITADTYGHLVGDERRVAAVTVADVLALPSG